MSKPPRISESEWEVMKICWSRSPVSAQQIIDALAPGNAWHPKTVKTLVNRLVNKGALGFTKEGRAYLYHPLVAESDCISAETKSFLDRVFGGSLRPISWKAGPSRRRKLPNSRSCSRERRKNESAFKT